MSPKATARIINNTIIAEVITRRPMYLLIGPLLVSPFNITIMALNKLYTIKMTSNTNRILINKFDSPLIPAR